MNSLPKHSIRNKYSASTKRFDPILKLVDDPDKIEVIKVNRSKLPRSRYREVGFEKRQVFDIDNCKVVIEFRAQVLENNKGRRYIAQFPKAVTETVQYGTGIKALAVYMSQYQLFPYQQIKKYFVNQLKIPVCEGSISNFNQQAYRLLSPFENKLLNILGDSAIVHTDETDISLRGKKHWFHCVSNDYCTYYYSDEKQGLDALYKIGLLPKFKGIIFHDLGEPDSSLDCKFASNNTILLDKLYRIWKQEHERWAKDMKRFLEKLEMKVKNAGGALSASQAKFYRVQYRKLIGRGHIEIIEARQLLRNDRSFKAIESFSQKLLVQMKECEDSVLRFMENKEVSFSKELEEDDVRMDSVRKKISKSIESGEGVKIFCRIRSYLSTCSKQGIKTNRALELLFNDKLPTI